MVNRLFKGLSIGRGYTPIVHPGNSELKYIEYGVLSLSEKGEEYADKTRNHEEVMVDFNGKFEIVIDCPLQKVHCEFTGSRNDVFSDKPVAIYLPRETAFRIIALSPNLEMGVSKAPSDANYPPLIVKNDEVAERTVGAWNWRRKIRLAVVDNVRASKLLVGETLNPPGNWSSFPPHKHDSEGPNEVPLEEVYFFKFKPNQGFGLQRIYTPQDDKDPVDEAYVIENNDTVVLPRGYHPVVAAPGYQMYYLWVLAGDRRIYGAWSDDSKHRWLRDCEPIINNIFDY